MVRDKQIRFAVGKGPQQGEVCLSAYLPQVLTLSVSYKGERAATVLLTRDQVRQLRQALDELAPQDEVLSEEGLRLVA